MSATASEAAPALERLAEAGAGLEKRFGDVEEVIKSWIKTRPGLTLGAAFATGVLIGWLIKRR
jgi:hypothetical protein